MSLTETITVVSLALTVLIAGGLGISTLIHVLNIDDPEGRPKIGRMFSGALLLAIALLAGNALMNIL